ncbi:MAG TPA: sigma-70 family RNA polymerase sigma factor [Ginsengibacter sp.]|nr:sigma-70 family RNA polymerase sigma factor [Ginsengibacter sp.]HRP43349.1 sigma-70 family RNA polymerase sigma factor [Ginsengibacter sp.]
MNFTFSKKSDWNHSFSEIYKQYYVSMINYARFKTGNLHVAEDLVHELFADIFAKKETIQNAETYLFSALKNRILNYWRHQEVIRAYESKILIEAPDAVTPHHSIELKDIMNNVHAHVKSLSPRCKKVFNLKREEYSNKEIATELDISLKTVEAHYTRALNVLKDRVVISIIAALHFVQSYFY